MSDLHPAVETAADAIATMEVRGAAAIAETAATALAAQARACEDCTAAEFDARLRAAARRLHATRPTAVSLPNALRYVLRRVEGADGAERSASVQRASEEFVERLDRAQDRLGRIGAGRLKDGDTVMTHCHSTDVLACVEAAVAEGKGIEAYVKETRPRLQGHITAAQLRDMGVPVTLIVDGAARRYLDHCDHVLVGADAIAADGSVVNKIGTSGLCVVARERGVPITVAAQTIKLDPGTLAGHTVEIEMREESEVITDEERAAIGDGAIRVENPAFDVTPPRYVDAIVTESGQFPPESIVTLIRELYGTDVADRDPW